MNTIIIIKICFTSYGKIFCVSTQHLYFVKIHMIVLCMKNGFVSIRLKDLDLQQKKVDWKYVDKKKGKKKNRMFAKVFQF